MAIELINHLCYAMNVHIIKLNDFHKMFLRCKLQILLPPGNILPNSASCVDRIGKPHQDPSLNSIIN